MTVAAPVELTEEQKDEHLETNLQDVAALCKHFMQTLIAAADEDTPSEQIANFIHKVVEDLAPILRKVSSHC